MKARLELVARVLSSQRMASMAEDALILLEGEENREQSCSSYFLVVVRKGDEGAGVYVRMCGVCGMLSQQERGGQRPHRQPVLQLFSYLSSNEQRIFWAKEK